MTNRTTDRRLGNLFGREPGSSAASLALRAGRAGRLARYARMGGSPVEALENRVLLGIDQPGFPMPWVPGTGHLVTLTVAGAMDPANGRGMATGDISSPSDDDMFRFVMPGAPGTRDFVTVLADTIPGNSTLDSYVQVYNNNGELIATGAHNGVLSSTFPNVATDGWAGFVGEGGMSYYVRVRSQQGTIAPGRTATGAYTLRIDAATIALPLDTAFNPAPDKGADTFGSAETAGSLTFRQEDVVYRVTTGSGPEWDSVGIANGVTADFAVLDVHLSVYDSGNELGQVVQIRDDRQAGRLTNAYIAFPSAAESTFFFRVRADELGAVGLSLGDYFLQVDMAALTLIVDPVTHLTAPERIDNVFGPAGAPGGTGAKLYQFQAQTTGLTIITVLGLPSGLIPALPDPAIHLYNRQGFQVAFNDDFNGLTPQLEVSLTGGDQYFLVVEGFDRAVNGAVAIFIEASHTFDPSPTQGIDDHINATPLTKENFQRATPIIFGPPTQSPATEGNPANPVLDVSWFQTGVARGRIHATGDTDVFQFVPPVDMLGEYAGDDGNQGRSLYVGGNFAEASGLPTENTAIWDAGRWWFGGPSTEASGAINGHVFALTEWDPDGAGPRGPILVAGGDFTFTDQFRPVTSTNIAFRVFSNILGTWMWSPFIDFDNGVGQVTVDGPVFALETFDLLITPTAVRQELIIGGQFTDVNGTGVSNVAALTWTGAGVTVNAMDGGVTGAGAAVRALAVFDPEQEEDPDDDGPMEQPMDRPAGLYVGGTFTTAGAVANVNNIARFGREDSMPATANTWEPLGSNGTNEGALGVTGGAVLALSAFQFTYTDMMGTDQDIEVLVVGGSFTSRGGRLAFWDASRRDGEGANRWTALGAFGTVRALQVWFPPDASGETGDVPVLVLAGDGSLVDGASGIVESWDGNASVTMGTAPIGEFTEEASSAQGTFHSLTAFTDDEPFFTGPQEVLYVGGTFLDIDDDPTIFRVAKLDRQVPYNPASPLIWQALAQGVDGESPAPPAPLGAPGVFALSSFNDNIGGVWDRIERKSSRVTLTVGPTTDAFINMFVQVYDSNLDLIYENNTTSPIFPDPAGTLEGTRPELIGPGADAFAPGFQVWGGEVYYIVVRGLADQGTGRYSLALTVDALPPEDPDDGNGVYFEPISAFVEVPNEGAFAIAPEIVLGVGSGDGRSFLNPHGANPSAYNVRVYDPTPAGVQVVHWRDNPVIETVFDTDLYKFRAPMTGTVELRIATRGITSLFQERQFDLIEGGFEAVLKEKTFDSPLDAAVRVFNNDFEEIVSPDPTHQFYVVGADDAFEVAGRSDVTYAGIFDGRTFTHSDPRIVLEVVAGESYFIQVESAFRGVALNPDPSIAAKVDWRHATGAYELMINAIPFLNGIDDHAFSVPLATPIAIDPTTGMGQISGVIDDVFEGIFINPNDNDTFAIIAPSRGQITVRVIPTSPLLQAGTTIFDNDVNVVAANVTPGAGTTVTLTFFASQGERFLINIDGANGTEGGYVIEVVAPPLTDDHADEGDWTQPTVLELQPFFGTATADGVIENPNDTDLFAYDSTTYEAAVVTVDAMAPGSLNPVVTIYEQTYDGRWNPAASVLGFEVFQIIGFNNDGVGAGTNSRVTFPMTPGRRYWVVVGGFNPDVDFGGYRVTLQIGASDDHPNVIDFPLATQINLTFDPLTQVGMGTANGRIEVNTDSDMFRFIAPATGLATITITTPDSGLAPRVEIRSASNTVLVMAADGVNGTVMVTIPSIALNQQYYIVVTPGVVGAGQPDDTGTYVVTVNTEPVDDHPNEGQFGLIVSPRDVVTLSPSSGVGTNTGIIVPATDTDLFRFATLAAGSTIVRITTPGSVLNPQVRVFNSSFVLIATAQGNGDSAQVTFNAPGVATYYILVLPATGASGPTAVGSYTVTVIGQRPSGGPGDPPPDDHVNAGEFADASRVDLDGRTGQGSSTGVVNYVGDTDLFRFTPAASGRVWVQIAVPPGGLIDGRVLIFDPSHNLIIQDSAGIAGATAAVSFNVQAGVGDYFVLVEPVGAAIGSYSVRVAAQPLTHFLYFAEGFSGPGVDEFVPIVNPNPFAVTYSIYAHYETGEIQTAPIFTGTIGANRRGGVTIFSKANPGASLVRLNQPYALEIRSSAQLGATLSRYDFDVSVGESFSNELSTVWTFAQVHKNPSLFRDFLVFLNPNSTDQLATIELFYQNGQKVTFTQNIRAGRRSGINVDADGRVSLQGNFGVRVTTNLPIMAGLSTYNLLNGGGDGTLGDAQGGSVRGVIPGLTSGSGVESNLSILNTGTTSSTVTITASYGRLDLPDLVRQFTVQPGRVLNLTGQQLGLLNGQQAGIRYSSSTPVTVSAIEYRNGDGNMTNTATFAAQQFVIGDAWVNPAQAGINYLETLGLYNPGGTTIQAEIQILFFDGATSTVSVTVNADDFAFVAVDQLPAVLSRPGPSAFSLVITAGSPIVVGFTHYDLNFRGGWGTLAAPIGLTNALSTL